jgi:hypothetical protein
MEENAELGILFQTRSTIGDVGHCIRRVSSQDLPEQEIHAACALLSVSLDHYKQQTVDILGPNWMFASSEIAGMSSEQALEALQQLFVILHSGAGKLPDSLKDQLESWSSEAQITVDQFMSSLPESVRHELSCVIDDLAITVGRMQKVELDLMGNLAIKKPPHKSNQEPLSNFSATNPKGRVRQKLGTAHQKLKGVSQTVGKAREKLARNIGVKRG